MIWMAIASAMEPVASGEHVELEFGAEGRAVYARVDNPDFGRLPEDPTGAMLMRASGWADGRLGPHVGLRLQLDTATQVGRDGGAIPLDVDAVHVQRAVLDIGQGAVSLRLGRDLWKLGNGLLVDDRQGPNVRRAFDGGWLAVHTDVVRVDSFVGAEVQAAPGAFDNLPTTGQLLWGTWVERDGGLPGTVHTVYYLGATREEVAYLSVSGDEVRHSFGTGWHGVTPRLQFDLDVLGQVGRVDARRIAAWGVAGEAGLPLEVAGAPMPFTAWGVASGDGAGGALGTFRAPFPAVQQLGTVAQLAPSNTFGGNVGLRLFPHPMVMVQGVVRGLWRTRTTDAIYAIPGFPSRAPSTDSRFVGMSEGVVAMWTPVPRVELGGFFDAFHPGAIIRDAPPARDSWLVSLAVTLRTEATP